MNDKKNKSPYAALSVVPANLKAGRPHTQQVAEETPPDNTKRWLMLSALVLVVALAFVGFILPALIGVPEPTQQSTTANTNTPALLYQREIAAKYRQNAQGFIAQIATIHVELEKLNVLQWAAEDFIAAESQAKAGDKLLRQQNYKESAEAYKNALAQMQQLQNRWPTFLHNELSAIEAHLTAGHLAEAKRQVQELLKIDPTNVTANTLTEKINVRWQTLTLIAEGQALLANNQLLQAVAKLQQAIQLDPEFKTTQIALKEALLALQDKAFRAAMSKALVAMSESQFADAVAAFLEADRLQSGPESQAGLQDAKRRLLIATLKPLKQRAEQAEKTENWTRAVVIYTQMLGLEASQEIIGQLKRSKDRLALDKKITTWLANTSVLWDDSKRQSAQQVVQLLTQAELKGARLQSQLGQLSKILMMITLPVKLTLTSDGSTTVRLYRVDSYKPFQRLELKLKPGEYTALGTRRGYRDVIHKFTLRPGASFSKLDIRCEEQI